MGMHRLPPLNALRAFEATARHLSVKNAADELCVTPGAVSQMLKVLELHLGVALFRRVNRGIFLVHGEDPGMDGLTQRIGGLFPADRIFRPALDDSLDLLSPKPTLIPAEPRRRLPPSAVGHIDWHNDLTKLVLDINNEMAKAADEKARSVILRRLRRALEGAEPS